MMTSSILHFAFYVLHFCCPGAAGDNGELAIFKNDVFDLNPPDVSFFEQSVNIDENFRVFQCHEGGHLEFERLMKPTQAWEVKGEDREAQRASSPCGGGIQRTPSLPRGGG